MFVLTNVTSGIRAGPPVVVAPPTATPAAPAAAAYAPATPATAEESGALAAGLAVNTVVTGAWGRRLAAQGCKASASLQGAPGVRVGGRAALHRVASSALGAACESVAAAGARQRARLNNTRLSMSCIPQKPCAQQHFC